jgi:hypothetical protein
MSDGRSLTLLLGAVKRRHDAACWRVTSSSAGSFRPSSRPDPPVFHDSDQRRATAMAETSRRAAEQVVANLLGAEGLERDS